ncbi:MAG: dihydroxyacetone kinase subunit L [Phycisphaerales bacterium]|nr:dihydroxyacetone kinase subunit L [Phycisphaerales bacterium]
MTTFTNQDGIAILHELIATIAANKQYLSDIDGKIGDGDHGINMNKGFMLCGEQLTVDNNLTTGLKTLSKVLMTQIGGSMGPLYGMFFRSMAKECDGVQSIDASVFGRMLAASKAGVISISQAKPGDKTLVDVLFPAEECYQHALRDGQDFSQCLAAMTKAARDGRDATENMVAKVGRSSRLGERSRGVIDAGAASCCLILETFSTSIHQLLRVGGTS